MWLIQLLIEVYSLQTELLQLGYVLEIRAVKPEGGSRLLPKA